MKLDLKTASKDREPLRLPEKRSKPVEIDLCLDGWKKEGLLKWCKMEEGLMWVVNQVEGMFSSHMFKKPS